MKNVILLTIDTLRKNVLSCYGSKDSYTPFIDSLTDQCLQFTRAQTIAPYTQASFPGLLTSSYFFDYPVSYDLSPKRTLISEALSRAGVICAGFHSNAHLCSAFGWDRGWNIFYDSMDEEVTDYEPFPKGDVINKNVDSWLASLGPTDLSKAKFLWVHYMDVHEPYIPAQKYIDAIDSSINLSKDQMFSLFTDVLLKRDVSSEETVQLLKKLYLAHVREVDEYVRMLFEIFDKHNLLEESTVIITSDHGDEFGEHSSLSHDGKMYSELIDCPLLIYNQANSDNQICEKLVSGIDIPPTILSLFGLDNDTNFQGQPLLPAENYVEKGCFGECIGKLSRKVKDTDKPTYFYREGDLKVIYRQEEDQWQMYDLDSDPQERNNIIDSHPESEQMKTKLRPRIDREV